MTPKKKTFYISDLHFNHFKILEFEKQSRPFKDVDEMNNHIISKWNSVVEDRDEVIVAGDVGLNVSPEILDELLSRLKGTKILVMGNHDSAPDKIQVYDKHFKQRLGVLDRYNGIVVTHIPIHPSSLEGRWKYNFHGHVHSKDVTRRDTLLALPEGTTIISRMITFLPEVQDSRYVNLSCEALRFTPRTKEELLNGH